MSNIFVPANGPEDWQRLLEKPDLHWKTGRSAKALAYCWQEARGFPRSVKTVFENSKLEAFQDVILLFAFPEYKVQLPGGKTSSQNDVFVLARGNKGLISMTVEGKVDEPFDKTISEWKAVNGKGKLARLEYLCNLLKLDKDQIDDIYYQLLHRTASAIIKARECDAYNALMLVHSFSRTNDRFDDYSSFLNLFGLSGVESNSVVFGKNIDGINLYFGWVSGDYNYLNR